jgi:sensor histidine kinase regulating citrate/malate metabolism
MIIGNIIDNAFEALAGVNEKSDKYICLATYIKQNYFYISIRNNGPEITERHLAKIFIEGFSTKSDDKINHGYGLYIVNENIKKHNGSINVTSTPHETEFLIELKVNKEYLDRSISKLKHDISINIEKVL